MNFKRKNVRAKLSDKAAQTLRVQILSGELKVGQHLVEANLSEKLEISNGPLRDALSILEKEGFVVTLSNGRTIVNELTPRFIDDYLDLSKYFLYTSVKQVVENTENSEAIQLLLEDLDGCNKELRDNILKGDSRGVNHVDDIFTAAIILASGNIMIKNMWFLMDGIRHGMYIVTEKYYNDLVISNEELIGNFQRFRDCIAQKDMDSIKDCIETHYKYRTKAYKDYFAQRSI